MLLSYYITYTAGEIFRYYKRCAYVLSRLLFFSGGLRITNPFTTRTFLGNKIGVSSKLRLVSELHLVRYFLSGDGRHHKQFEEVNKHEDYKIHQY